MFDLFLKLLGVENAEDARIVERHMAFANLKTPFQILLFLMASAGAAYVVWWFYKREPDYCPIKKRKVMAGLRYAGIAVLLFILSGPMLKLTLQNNIKGKVVILIDNSKSMSRVDKYTRSEDKLVVAHALGKIPLKEVDSKKNEMAAEQAIAGVTRMDIVRGVLKNPEFNFLETLQRKYDVEMHTFSRASDMKAVQSDTKKLQPTVMDSVHPDGVVTEIGGAIRKTLEAKKGQALSAVILFSDGGNNKGEEPSVVAQDAPVRIFPVGIGVPEARDVSIAYVFMESKIFVKDLAPIYVRIKQHGFAGETADLIVTSNGDEIGRQTVQLRDVGEQNEVLRIKPKTPGKFTYKVEIRLQNLASEDSEPGNNFKSRDVEVIDQKLKVLIVESEPRWEYRYLKNSLLRDKDRVDCNIVLRVPDMAELHKSSPTIYLSEFPSAKDLFKYHVIIFGNMPNDGFFTDHDIDNLRRFVIEEGGGMWFIAGKNNLPDSYKDSKLETLLPIEFEQNPTVTAEDEQMNPITDPFRPILTAEGRSHSVTRLDVGSSEGSEEQNAGLWEMMPDMYWFHKATRPKLGASTLIVAGAEKGREARGGPAPLLVASQVGRGRVLYQAFADLWRMRYPSELGPDALERLHSHVVQYLGLAKLLGRSARIEINTDKEEYAVGDRIKITARVLTKEMDYSAADHHVATATDRESDANRFEAELTPEPGQRGVYRGEMTATADGKFRVTLKDEDDDTGAAHADYTVTMPQVEMETPNMNKDLLENIAKSSVKSSVDGDTKANMYYADQCGQLLKDLNQAQRVIEEKKEITLWDAPILLILFTLFMGGEWLIRKRSDLL